MVLLLQLNGELPDKFPGHDRRLYVFACRRQTCQRRQGSVRAIRGTRISKEAVEASKAAKEAQEAEEKRRKEEASKPKNEGPGLGNALFGGAPAAGSGVANPFSSGSANPFSSGGGAANSNPFASGSSSPFSSSAAAAPAKQEEPKKEDPASALPKTFAETLNLNNTQKVEQGPPPPPEAWPAADKLPKPYPVSYLSDAEYETLDPEPAPVPQKTEMEIDDTPEQGGSGGIDKEVFESSMDAVFQKFADRLAQNPDQSIRYEYGGTPLLYSKKDNVGKVLTAAAAAKKSGMPRCGNCGAGRVFEVQLTPQAITELEEQEELGLEGMEWGTVIVGVCEADCLARGSGDDKAGYVEEWCGVQWEELAKK